MENINCTQLYLLFINKDTVDTTLKVAMKVNLKTLIKHDQKYKFKSSLCCTNQHFPKIDSVVFFFCVNTFFLCSTFAYFTNVLTFKMNNLLNTINNILLDTQRLVKSGVSKEGR